MVEGSSHGSPDENHCEQSPTMMEANLRVSQNNDNSLNARKMQHEK